MDLLKYSFLRKENFGIASIPLVTFFYLKSYCKIPSKKIFVVLICQFLVSTYFWIKMEDTMLFLYQLVPYVSAFICNGGDAFIEYYEKKHGK